MRISDWSSDVCSSDLEFFGEEVKKKLVYYPTVTREAFRNQGRVTDLITSGKLFSDLGLPPLNIENDRIMLCGSPAMLADMRTMLDGQGWQEIGSASCRDSVCTYV